MSQSPAITISHIGICTSNVEHSVKFYTEALGFELLRSIDEIGPPFDDLVEIPGTVFCAHHLKCGEVTIELVGYPDTEVTGSAERRPMNQLGFTHMTLGVDNVNEVLERIKQFGGHVHTETKIDSPFGPIIFCTDPDGVRIEVMQKME